MTTTQTRTNDLFEQISNDLADAIEAGAATWTMPWTQLGANLNPTNVDGRPYRGLNVLILAFAAADRGWTSGTWATYKAWQRHDCQVRRGEKGTQVVLWKPVTKEVETDSGETETHKHLIARTYTVFAAEQVDGFQTTEVVLTEHERIDQCERFFAAAGADVVEGGDRACYVPTLDQIRVPALGQFHQPEHYYSTLAHEHVHWTGHTSRLDRDLNNRFGDDAYAVEELIAEVGAAMLTARLGIAAATRDDHASYVSHWLRVLREDPKALVTVASRCQAAVDFLDDKQVER